MPGDTQNRPAWHGAPVQDAPGPTGVAHKEAVRRTPPSSKGVKHRKHDAQSEGLLQEPPTPRGEVHMPVSGHTSPGAHWGAPGSQVSLAIRRGLQKPCRQTRSPSHGMLAKPPQGSSRTAGARQVLPAVYVGQNKGLRQGGCQVPQGSPTSPRGSQRALAWVLHSGERTQATPPSRGAQSNMSRQPPSASKTSTVRTVTPERHSMTVAVYRSRSCSMVCAPPSATTRRP